MNRLLKNSMVFLLIVLLVLSIYSFSSPPAAQPEKLDYTQFRDKVISGQVAAVDITGDSKVFTIEGEYKDGKSFVVKTFPNVNIADFLIEHNVASIDYDQQPPTPWWIEMLSILIPMLLIVGVLIFIMNQSQGYGGKVMQFGKSRAKLHTDDRKSYLCGCGRGRRG